MLSQLTHLKSDPLDVLLFGLGLRLTQLAKSNDEKFKSLLENRNFTIQLGSEAEGINRYFSVKDGQFSQTSGEATEPTLTITFKDSITGAKLLTKGDAAAFMTGIQKGDLKMSGDYSLLMWFNQVAKFIVPKVPEQLQPIVEQAKPLLEKAMPIVQGLFTKVQSLLGGESQKVKSGESKYFKDVKDDTKPESESTLDSLKAKANELKEGVTEKIDDLKTVTEEKIEEVKGKLGEAKETAETKLADVKETAETKLVDVKEQAESKLADVKDTAQTKLADVKEATTEKLDATKAKVEEVKDKADGKLDTLNEEAKEKISEVKEQASQKVESAKTTISEKADELTKQVQVKTDEKTNVNSNDKKDEKSGFPDLTEYMEGEESDLSTASRSKFDELLKSREVEQGDEEASLTPAIQKSHELEAKHVDDKVIAEDVKIPAVKDDKSPITEVSVTKKS